MPGNLRANKYDHTPRKVFDKYVDRMDLKLMRAKEDHRSDIGTLVRQIRKLESQFTLTEHRLELLEQFSKEIVELWARDWARKHSTEEL